jgi:hypothetical protein
METSRTRNSNSDASIAKKVRASILRRSNQFIYAEEFPPVPAVRLELGRLAKKGEIARVRRGVYWRGRQTRFGMSPPERTDLVREIFRGEAVGATGWYATNLLGLSTQVAPAEAFAVTMRPPTSLGRVQVVDRSSRKARRTAHLTDLEVTFLEALEGWERYVEVDLQTATDRFISLVRHGQVRADRLVRASKTEPPVVRERLRWLLHRAGLASLAEKVEGARDPRTRERALASIGIAD